MQQKCHKELSILINVTSYKTKSTLEKNTRFPGIFIYSDTNSLVDTLLILLLAIKDPKYVTTNPIRITKV